MDKEQIITKRVKILEKGFLAFYGLILILSLLMIIQAVIRSIPSDDTLGLWIMCWSAIIIYFLSLSVYTFIKIKKRTKSKKDIKIELLVILIFTILPMFLIIYFNAIW